MNTIAVYEKDINADWINDAIEIKARKILVLKDEIDNLEYPILITEKDDPEKLILKHVNPNDTLIGIIDVESETKKAFFSGKVGINYSKVWFLIETIKKAKSSHEYNEQEVKAIHLIKSFIRS